ncbi:acetate/propionate family kinase [Legionella israelensis]|uniref:Acetate kinase n=1 Tax=Legionella israelensis TaxID=454 RepID=A0A0W0WJ44_9GAMM|nr:acetate/propionate family kinase [Legionella israelensis]KTD32070.1 acetate kinase [Legionella israelensis]QBS10379.1 acetate/propionate family kinase [Legionella israelensis]SCY33864.1 acetate kinase [Legionella israelensis DSM 19235]STX59990.1 Acetate kinase (Acetokinase) [Legionella israelensis]
MNNETNDSILVINTGSSSIKFQLFKAPHLHLLVRGKMTHIGNTPCFTAMKTRASEDKPQKIDKKLPGQYTYKEALNYILNWIGTDEQNGKISIVAHRVVHGGEYFTKSTRITSEVFSKLKSLCSLAPLHQPHNLAAIELLAELQPEITQIACFDTAFHSGHDRLFVEYALPENIRNKDVRRYGFHGLSYEWIVYKLQENEPGLAKGRIVAAHLGNGASLCAIHNGISIDTTMGMTALDGLPMGTRCGSLDPGVIIYLIRELGLSADEVESLLYNESGLKGLSNWTNDVRLLQESDSFAAKFALDYFCIKTAQYICMMSASLGGIDGIVFTGGIGENSEYIRQRILSHLAFLRPFEIHVIRANEERIMAMHAMRILNEE